MESAAKRKNKTHNGIMYYVLRQDERSCTYRCSNYKDEQCSAKIYERKATGDVELRGTHKCRKGTTAPSGQSNTNPIK